MVNPTDSSSRRAAAALHNERLLAEIKLMSKTVASPHQGNALRLGRFYVMPGVRRPIRSPILECGGIQYSVASVLVLTPNAWWTSFIVFVWGVMVWLAATGYQPSRGSIRPLFQPACRLLSQDLL